ncbi:protein FRIGIDA-ESSENTIAL 1-like isoform X2 [Prosopis cineraria]|uniref:protein FRIGIDA-ESSENTIAL 1-like isoform X2 n=1 Tax=Prosopis cineraria TaxID=364024 RepID=UPI0024108C9C|nr:protein FRIGIDA-ESSENTIAL 1-like isoform X2 [Prosopis cineraria]
MRSVGQEGNLISVSPAIGNFEVKSPSNFPFVEGNAAITKVSVPSYHAPTIRKKDIQLERRLSSSPESRKNLDLEDDITQGLEADIENAGSLLKRKTFGEYSEPSCNYTSYLHGANNDISCGTSKSFTDFGKDGTIDLQSDCFVEKASGDRNHVKHLRKLNMQSGDAMNAMTSRHPSPDLRTRDLSPCAEIKLGNKRHAIQCAFFAKGWCIRGDSCSFLHIKDPVNKSGQQIEGELVAQNWKREVQPEEDIGDDFKRSLMPCTQVPLPATQERTSLYSSEFYSNAIIQKVCPSWDLDKSWPVSSFPSYPAHTEGMTATRGLDMHYGYTSVVESHSPNLKFSSYEWEPSVHFEPSVSSGMWSVEDQKDPFHGSLEILNIGDESLKAFNLSQRSSIQSSYQVPKNGDSAEAASQVLDLRDAKSSVSSHYRCKQNEPEKSYVPHGKSILATETDRIARSYLNRQFGRLDMGLNFTFEDVINIEKEQIEHDARLQVEVTQYEKQKVDRDKKNSEMDNNFQKDDGVQIEMALRNFRFALADHVKKILRPLWHEGHLSKDAHIVIVKKSVDKIVGSLQPQQIPPNEDSVKKYISFCHVKVVNLVKEYTGIYGKV